MKRFLYTIKSPMRIRARSAGLLSKLTKNYGNTVATITKGGDTA